MSSSPTSPAAAQANSANYGAILLRNQLKGQHAPHQSSRTRYVAVLPQLERWLTR